jgi:predicted nuclease of predicted toxin-antitoxin system
LRFLADENIEKPVVDYPRSQGYDVSWVAEIERSSADDKILDTARREKRILLTNDKDFGELVFLQRKLTTGVILFRFETEDALSKVMVLMKVIPQYIDKLSGHFTVISENRIRFRYISK